MKRTACRRYALLLIVIYCSVYLVVSQWGHDFRPDYKSLGNIRPEFNNVPIMALTATANEKVIKDTSAVLKLRNPLIHKQSYNRPNLYYEVRMKDSKVIENMCEIIKSRKKESGIIYCLSRKDTETVCEKIIETIPEMKNQITFYHANLPPETREKRQKNWSKGTIKVIW
jgi:bloom syndrome protein